MTAGTAIKAYRTGKGLTQKEFGAKFGVTDVTVWRWEKGARQVDPALVPVVSAETGIPPKEIRPDLAELLKDGGG